MAFRIGDIVYTHSTGKITLVPEEGKAKGQPFEVLAAKSMSMELGGKAIVLMGNSIVPVATALASAEPVFTFGLDVMQVTVDLAEHVGDGYAAIRYSGIVTWQRPGLAPVTFRALGCTIEKGFGFKSDAGGAPNDEISGKFRDMELVYKGKTYRPFSLQGGISL